MTFAPVIPAVVLLLIAAAVVVLRLITMRALATGPRQRWATVWRWSGLTLALLLVLIAAARPGIGGAGPQTSTAAPQSGDSANVFFVVDRSTDSGDAIREDIASLIDQHPQSRFAMISFASRPSLDWPLSQDAWSLKAEIAALAPYDEPSDLVNAAAAANVLRYQLIAAAQQYPDSPNLVYYFGSGAPGSRAPQGTFDLISGSVDGGAVFGYGAGRNEPALQAIAEQIGVPYVHRDGGAPVAHAAADDSAAPPTTVASGQRTELYWVFTIAAAVLLLFEVYLSIREFRRSRVSRREVML